MSEELHLIVLDKLWPILHGIPNGLSIWLSHDYSIDHWEPKLSEWQDKIDKIRAWAKELPDKPTRKEYLGWLDFYQRSLDSAREELRTQDKKKTQEDYDRRLKEKDERKSQYAENNIVPSPPR